MAPTPHVNLQPHLSAATVATDSPVLAGTNIKASPFALTYSSSPFLTIMSVVQWSRHAGILAGTVRSTARWTS